MCPSLPVVAIARHRCGRRVCSVMHRHLLGRSAPGRTPHYPPPLPRPPRPPPRQRHPRPAPCPLPSPPRPPGQNYCRSIHRVLCPAVLNLAPTAEASVAGIAAQMLVPAAAGCGRTSCHSGGSRRPRNAGLTSTPWRQQYLPPLALRPLHWHRNRSKITAAANGKCVLHCVLKKTRLLQSVSSRSLGAFCLLFRIEWLSFRFVESNLLSSSIHVYGCAIAPSTFKCARLQNKNNFIHALQSTVILF